MLPIAVNRQQLAGHGMRDHQGDEFVRELARAIVVGASRDDGWESVCLHRCIYNEVSSCLGGSVRTVRRERRSFCELPGLAKTAIDLVRAHLQKPADPSLAASFHHPP